MTPTDNTTPRPTPCKHRPDTGDCCDACAAERNLERIARRAAGLKGARE